MVLYVLHIDVINTWCLAARVASVCDYWPSTCFICFSLRCCILDSSPALIAQFGFVLTSPCMPAAVPPGCQYGGTAVTRGTIRAALWEAALLAAGAGRCGSAARRELPRRGSSPREFCSAVVWNGVCAVLHLLPWFLRGRRSAGTEPGSDCVNWSVVSIPL